MLATLRVSVSALRAAARSVGSLPGPEAVARRAAARPLGTGSRGRHRTCVVDPNLEEPLVLVDLDLDLEPDRDPEHTGFLKVHLHQEKVPPPRQEKIRTLERQLEVLRGIAGKEPPPDSLIEFQDVDFPLDLDATVSKKKKKVKKNGEHKVCGTVDVEEPVSDTRCSGCGAILHCMSTTVPGFLPSEKFKVLAQEERLGDAICQRCHLLTHHHKALNLQVSPEQYRDVVRQLRPQKALVLLIVDLLGLPDSLVQDLPELVGTNKRVVVLGNKIDLLPKDAPNYLPRIRRRLLQCCQEAGIGDQVADVHLISAKTGFGIEGLISSLQRTWRYKGDVYLVGGANAGKSTLFNVLLESDFCKSKASDIVNKATISPWPGTTLNLLKFPIINPTPQRMSRRQERLDEASRQTESELPHDELRKLEHLSRQGYLVGRVGRTFHAEVGSNRRVIEFDPDTLAFGENVEGDWSTAPRKSPEFTYNELKDARWLFDTPGIMKERDILSLLTEQEVRSVVPTQAIVPRTFVLKPGMTLFLGALARIDFLEGAESCWLSVMASSRVPVHVTSLERADAVYEKHAGRELLGVPFGGSERMKTFPTLVPRDVQLEGCGHLEAAADITLSSAGWVAATAAAGRQMLLRLHGPEEAGFGVRMPPLLPHVAALKGARVGKSAAYRTLRMPGRLGGGMEASGAQRLHIQKKKKMAKKKA